MKRVLNLIYWLCMMLCILAMAFELPGLAITVFIPGALALITYHVVKLKESMKIDITLEGEDDLI